MDLRARKIPCAAVQTPEERIDKDPTTQEFGLWPMSHHTAIGDVAVDGQPVHMSKSDWHIEHGAPCLSEHTEDVLTRLLGMQAGDVATLREQGVI
jgi:crotonobetainyl-CoA:carnitine CoA-transferase CaiB-like acyl-CoA transferase